MSLDLGVEGMAYNSVKVAGTAVGLAALADTDFDAGSDFDKSSRLQLQLDNSGTPSANIGTDLPIPSALGVIGGTELVLINDFNGQKINFTDPITGIAFNYVNRAGESITLVSDEENDQWIMGF